LKEGETILARGRVQCAVEGVLRNGKLILTDRRIVLVPDGKGRSWWLPRPLMQLLAATSDVISHQIVREELSTATVTGKTLEVRSKGEGYGMTHFDVTTHEAEVWAARLDDWAAGTLPPR
jgi:hypothetical protein